MKVLLIPALFASLLLSISCGNTKSSPNANTTAEVGQPVSETTKVKPTQMTKALFVTNVFDFTKSPENWMYRGTRPCVIDFYADWCRPCKQVAPLMEGFAATYQGKVDIYKVNVDQERELAELFGIRSIPTVLFCPMEGKPQMSQGAMSKENYEQIINGFLLKQTKKSTSN
ncbi:MAG TPA: thioredoxin domain-containing protein [Bacteroidales bacterium]